jgi:hypothetical protein
MMTAIATPTSLVYFDGTKTYTVRKGQPNFEVAVKAYKEGDEVKLRDSFSLSKSIVDFVLGRVKIVGNDVFLNGKVSRGLVVDRILTFMSEGIEPIALIRFLDKLSQNPSDYSREQLYNFIEKYHCPITPDGNIILYKGVRNDYNDIYSNTICNKVGEVVSMPREKVVDNPNSTCDVGLHCAYMDYAKGWAGYARDGEGRLMLVEVNPTDVCSVPNCSDGQKIRVCHYTVVAEYGIEAEDIIKSQTFNPQDGKYNVRDKNGRFAKKRYDVRDSKGKFTMRVNICS